MKKLMTAFLTGALGLGVLGVGGSSINAAEIKPVAGSKKLAVLVDARKVKFDGGDPFVEDKRVQVPLRGIGEALGAKIGFDAQTVTYEKNRKSIKLTLGSKVAIVDGKSVTMDTVAKAINGRTYVPLRFVSENLGEKVTWDQVGNWVWIGSQEVPDIEEVTELQDLTPYEEYFEGKDNFIAPYGEEKKRTKARMVSYEDMPVVIGDKTLLDMWLVREGIEEIMYIRFKGPKRLTMYLLIGDGDIRPRSGHIVEQSDGTFIIQIVIKDARDKAIYKDENWKKFTTKSFDYFFLTGSFGDDSARMILNPFK
ncbi:Copper amine oxidase N-terminal domain-containing protein [Fontibacillus panacisegetis]|uniref:Copper amine oxidase N-terminal domain-containing protein n=1 Tax=Fontibacillus panacisegetis TaxID=670482 RepID=A0A1G7I523_9BACL|nr:copper amine oxidase N-terminal domain-containing protein [Fontibacillus panacisegetis]SDF07812.1 Copper amine oxidase N-terminal domain-containing protein [Fontibacillus panacisegetis]